jgi:hypothetical protein
MLTKGAVIPLHVLSVYEYEGIPATGLSPEMDARHRDDQRRRADDLMERRMEDFIVHMALSVMADVLVIGSHSKRGILDIALGGPPGTLPIRRRAQC